MCVCARVRVCSVKKKKHGRTYEVLKVFFSGLETIKHKSTLNVDIVCVSTVLGCIASHFQELYNMFIIGFKNG